MEPDISKRRFVFFEEGLYFEDFAALKRELPHSTRKTTNAQLLYDKENDIYYDLSGKDPVRVYYSPQEREPPKTLQESI